MLNKAYDSGRDTSGEREARKKKSLLKNVILAVAMLVIIGFALFAYRIFVFFEGWD